MAAEQPGAGRAILEVLARLEAKVDRLLAQQGGSAAPGVASDADLDGQYGNPEVKKDPPRNWSGASFVGSRFSECPPEYLDALASFFDWKAGKDEEQAKAAGDDEDTAKAKAKYARYARTDAARARGWAARLRAGWKPPAPQGDSSTDGW